MAIYRLVGIQGCGKNLTKVGMAAYFVENYPEIYSYDRVYANFHLIYPGSNYLCNTDMKAFLRKIFAKPELGGELGQHKNIIILIDEIDGLYPQWGHGDKEAQRDLSGAYQDEKLHLQMFCSTHKFDNFNKIIRDACEIICAPELIESEDRLYTDFYDDRFKGEGEIAICPASVLYECYDRDEVVI
jgi:hypothetical protein